MDMEGMVLSPFDHDRQFQCMGIFFFFAVVAFRKKLRSHASSFFETSTILYWFPFCFSDSGSVGFSSQRAGIILIIIVSHKIYVEYYFSLLENVY